MTFYIYGLIDPITNELRYVGKTYNLCIRYNAYLSNLKRNSHKNNWIKKLISNGMKPEIYSFEEFELEDKAYEAEEFYISYFRGIGCNLINESSGGRGGASGIIRSLEFRKQKSNAIRGNKNPMYGKIGKLNHFYGKSHSDSMKRIVRKLTMIDAENIRNLYASNNHSLNNLAFTFGVSKRTILRIIQKRSYND